MFKHIINAHGGNVVIVDEDAVMDYYTVNHKKRDILFLTITLANLNQFL